RDGHAAGAADEQAFLRGEAAGHSERVAVGNRDDLVGDIRVVGPRPEVLANPLDEVRAPSPSGVDGALRVGADDAHLAVGDFFEVLAGAADRAAGTDAGDEVGDPPVRLTPQLGAGRVVVTGRVCRVGVLVGFPGTVDLAHEPVGDAVVRLRV